jgi:co-chaperonin GroES (HSP10)
MNERAVNSSGSDCTHNGEFWKGNQQITQVIVTHFSRRESCEAFQLARLSSKFDSAQRQHQFRSARQHVILWELTPNNFTPHGKAYVTQVSPRGEHVYVKVQEAEEKTLGGVLLPGSAQQRPTSGRVVSVGDGKLPQGKSMEFTVKAGDEVRRSLVLRTPKRYKHLYEAKRHDPFTDPYL